MPLDPSQPSDNFDIPAFPGYLRGVWVNNILPAHVPMQFTLYQAGPVQASLNAGNQVVVSATPGLPININSVEARVKVPSQVGDIGVDVMVNGESILGALIVIPQGLLRSASIIPSTLTLHNGDLVTVACTAPGEGAADLSVHLLCQARVTYP